ncbi:MAG: nucleotidyltransferase domain-containing protein [Chloroflexi bacterium]|nr:nucleotidyltransferase domain-containing protein [Chloroflexota bacterium]
MANKPNKNTVKNIVDSLVAQFSPQKVILFGSGVAGSGDAQSDIDLLIIKETDESFFNRLADARRAVAGTHNGIPLDLLVLTPQELKERLDRGDQFIKDITEKGRLLYGA